MAAVTLLTPAESRAEAKPTPQLAPPNAPRSEFRLGYGRDPFFPTSKDVVIKQPEIDKPKLPAEAAKDFMIGHINVQLAIVFEQIDWRMSEGAYLVIREAMKRIFRPDWKGVFDMPEVKASVKKICDAE